jgi:hypothetical protein
MAVDCDIVTENLKLYKNILFPPKIYDESFLNATDPLLTLLNITVQNTATCPGYPDDQMDESCKS